MNVDSFNQFQDDQPWIVKYGIWTMTIIFSFVVFLSAFVQYPELVEVRITLNSINGPKPVILKSGGRVSRILIRENQYALEGDAIAHIESLVSPDDVISLDEELTNYIERPGLGLAVFFSDRYKNLGELQVPFQAFMEEVNVYNTRITSGYYRKKIRYLKQVVGGLRRKSDKLRQEAVLQSRADRLFEEGLSVSKQLFHSKVISLQDLRIEEAKLLLNSLKLPQIEKAIIDVESLEADTEIEMLDLVRAEVEDSLRLYRAIAKLKGHIQAWRHQYILTSPGTGTLSFSSFLQEGHQVSKDQILGYVSPKDSEVYGEMVIDQMSMGKVKIGQVVWVRLDAYPFQKYGEIAGVVDQISEISISTGYLAKVKLPNGLVTEHHVNIRYRSGLRANGLVVSENFSLAERLWYNIVYFAYR